MVKARNTHPQDVAIPDKFVPLFWQHIDQRAAIVRTIRRRYERLKEDVGAESAQQDMLCQRAIFIGVQLETIECNAAIHGKIDMGVYTQMVNTLLGLLKALGLKRATAATGLTLKAHLKERER